MKILPPILCILMLLCHPLHGQPHPDSAGVADEYAKLFIEGVNSSLPSRQREIVMHVFSASALTNPGIEKLMGLMQRLHADYAPLEFHHAEVAEFHQRNGLSDVLHIYAKRQGDRMWQDFQVRLESPPSRRFSGLGFIAEVAEPVYLPPGALDQQETLAWLDRYVQRLHDDYDLFGSILIARGETALFERYFGYADAERRTPLDSVSLFNLGSGNKMFTALCIARLAEQGKLTYTDSLTRYLPGFPDRGRAGRITIHHLLTHTSGIAEYWTEASEPAVAACTTVSDHLRIVYRAGFQGPPGVAYRYCNSNYILLGGIIEKVTGRDYYEVVREVVYDRARMTASGSYFADDRSLPLVTPLTREGHGWSGAPRHTRGSSAGGGYATAREMLKFSGALKQHRIVGQETLRPMLAVQTAGLEQADDYGYGFILERTPAGLSYGHGGISRGVNYEFRVFPAEDITLVLFCNQDNGAYDDLKKNTIKLITGER